MLRTKNCTYLQVYTRRHEDTSLVPYSDDPGQQLRPDWHLGGAWENAMRACGRVDAVELWGYLSLGRKEVCHRPLHSLIAQ
jgi:hypothetical protein